jgi:T-complex protein 1 subunit gamma
VRACLCVCVSVCRLVGWVCRALEECLEALSAQSRVLDQTKRDQLLDIVKTCVGTKFSSRFGDQIAGMALDAVLKITVDNKEKKTKEIDIKRFARVEKIPGGFLEESRVLSGLMLNKDVVHEQMRRKIVNPRIIL